MYKITIKKTAAKELNELPDKIAASITTAIFQLAENPRPAGCKKLKGKNVDAGSKIYMDVKTEDKNTKVKSYVFLATE